MHTLSSCCKAGIQKSFKFDPHPLGRNEYNGFGITETVYYCEECQQEDPDEVLVGECCGEVGCNDNCEV